MIVPEPIQHAVEVAARCALIFSGADTSIATVAVIRPDEVMFVTESSTHRIAVDDAEWIAARVVEINRDGIIARHRPGWV